MTTVGEWIMYPCPWWVMPLWAFAAYVVGRFLVHYVWKRIRKR